MAKRIAILMAVILTAACARRSPVSDEVTVEFVPDDEVIVTAQTSFDPQATVTEEGLARVESARSAAVSATDAWAVRFARLAPKAERLTFEKEAGELDRVIRSVRVPARDLQQVFSDASITVNVLRGEGWSELSFYTNTSPRATREQQARFRGGLDAWSTAVARYFTAVHQLYSYMDRNPHRARELFAALVGTEPELEEMEMIEGEQALVDDVLAAMEKIAARMDEEEESASSFEEDADAIYNPFPARVTIEAPGEILSSEGFELRDKHAIIEPIDLLETITKLEGKWIAPDPLAALLREQTRTPHELAKIPRHSTAAVSAQDVADAVREQLTRPQTYVVRWRD